MKKILSFTILIIGACTIAKAQTLDPTDPHWCKGCSPVEKQNIARQLNAAHPALGKNDASTNGDRGIIPRPRTDQRPSPYLLKVHFLVRNETDKKIKRVTWDYTITNRETKAFIQTVTFVTEKTIAPRKSAVLKQKVIVPMEKLQGATVPVSQSGQKPPRTIEVEENYQIKEIKYADGSLRTP